MQDTTNFVVVLNMASVADRFIMFLMPNSIQSSRSQEENTLIAKQPDSITNTGTTNQDHQTIRTTNHKELIETRGQTGQAANVTLLTILFTTVRYVRPTTIIQMTTILLYIPNNTNQDNRAQKQNRSNSPMSSITSDDEIEPRRGNGKSSLMEFAIKRGVCSDSE